LVGLGYILVLFGIISAIATLFVPSNVEEYFGILIIISGIFILIGLGILNSNRYKKGEQRDYSSTQISNGVLISIIFTILIGLLILPNSDAPPMEIFFVIGFILVILIIIFLILKMKVLVKYLTNIARFGGKPTPVALYSLKNPTRKINRTGLMISIFTLVIFLIVALSINIAIQQESIEAVSFNERGGYDILGESAIPIELNLSSELERMENNIDAPILNNVSITEIKVVGPPGGTCSNMNVRYPPRLLGVSSEFILENKFEFMESLKDDSDSIDIWRSLDKNPEENSGRIPIVVDYNTLVWIYSGSLGEVYEIQVEDGSTVELEVIAVLENTIFGGTFIMSEENLDELFPKTATYQYILFKVQKNGEATPEQVAIDLELALDQYGFDAQAIRQLILENREYERSFMSLFQAYLGLGLILGIIGLGVVMARNVQERRYEIGVLRTIGYTKKMLLKSFILELSFISILSSIIGLLAGVFSTFLVFGTWTGHNYNFVIPWSDLIFLLIIVYIISLLSALYPAYRASTLPPAQALSRVS
jgi:putative ABC transport system permease protein